MDKITAFLMGDRTVTWDELREAMADLEARDIRQVLRLCRYTPDKDRAFWVLALVLVAAAGHEDIIAKWADNIYDGPSPSDFHSLPF